MVLQMKNILEREVPQIFAAPRLFGQTKPIQSAGVSGSGNRIIPRWLPNKNGLLATPDGRRPLPHR